MKSIFSKYGWSIIGFIRWQCNIYIRYMKYFFFHPGSQDHQNIASSKLSSLLFIDEKFSCLRSQSSMYTKVFHNIPFKSHILRAFLLNIVIYIDCANEIQETLKMAWWDLEPLKLHDRLAYWPISVCMVNPLKNRV